jgi:FkbM family methyltransferase
MKKHLEIKKLSTKFVTIKKDNSENDLSKSKTDVFLKRKVESFQTDIGIYYLPTDIETDIIIKTMKSGQIFEPEILETAKRFIRRGSVVLDLGANFGQMSLLFSELVGEEGHIYSFEASDEICEILKKNIEVNNRNNITPICKAVFDSIGETKFYPEPDFSRFGSYGSYGIDPKAVDGRTVNTITIDSLDIKGTISFMKVDIQGSDLFALKGARETIMRNRMPILFEYEKQFQEEFGTSFVDYMQFVESVQYRVVEVITDINFLIIPKEMNIDITTGLNSLSNKNKRHIQKKFISLIGIFRKKFYEIPDTVQMLIAQYTSPHPYKEIASSVSFNRILNNRSREKYQSVIEQMKTYLPRIMARKIPEANVQQAFVLDSVYKFAKKKSHPKILCVGSFEDTAAACLKMIGYRIEEIDPALNYDLETYFHLPATDKGSFDIIFSTSVIEHVADDETFISQIAELLAPQGVGILTCDYNNSYRLGDRLPKTDMRFYTKKDFIERLIPCAKDCTLVDDQQWDDSMLDFIYDGCLYTFATLTFQKRIP